MTVPTVPQNAQAEYVALTTINHNGVPAYHPGDPIFASAVERLPEAVVDGDGQNVAAYDSNEAQALLRAQAKVTGDSSVPAEEQLRAAMDEEGAPQPGQVGAYDPTRHSVDEVNKYLADQSDAEKARVLEAEKRTQGRNGIVSGPHAKAAAEYAKTQTAQSASGLSAPVRGDIAEA